MKIPQVDCTLGFGVDQVILIANGEIIETGGQFPADELTE
jgi:hypothetical protein